MACVQREANPFERLREELESVANHLIRVDQRQQTDVRELRADLARLREEFSRAIPTAIEASDRKFFTVRLTGFVVALFGSFVLAASNLL